MSATHKCPGLCGRDVPDDLFACRACWYRLPREFRYRITQTGRRRDRIGYAKAVHQARSFYRSEL